MLLTSISKVSRTRDVAHVSVKTVLSGRALEASGFLISPAQVHYWIITGCRKTKTNQACRPTPKVDIISEHRQTFSLSISEGQGVTVQTSMSLNDHGESMKSYPPLSWFVTPVQWNNRMIRSNNHCFFFHLDIIHMIFCCLISRDEEEGPLGTADADKNLILTWKSGTTMLCCSSSSPAVYFNKHSAWSITVFLRTTKCIVYLSVVIQSLQAKHCE